MDRLDGDPEPVMEQEPKDKMPRRRYEKPAIRRSEPVFEKGALSCGKNPDTDPSDEACLSVPTVS